MGPQAPKQNVDGVRWGRDYRGNTWIGDELVTEGHRGMSKGYAGPDVAFVHPQERAVDMRSEWEVRLGPSRAERKRRAWTDNTPVKPDAVDPYATCGRCGMKLPASFQAQHHRESSRCQGTRWTPILPEAPALRKAPPKLLAGSAGLQSTCQACEHCVFGTSLAELEAAEERHLADSERCRRWERERVAVTPRGHRLQPRQSPAAAHLAARYRVGH